MTLTANMIAAGILFTASLTTLGIWLAVVAMDLYESLEFDEDIVDPLDVCLDVCLDVATKMAVPFGLAFITLAIHGAFGG